jgi:c-di-GMP-binding flagellar brake protein YcgR
MLGTLKAFFGKKESVPITSDSEPYSLEPNANPNFLTDAKKINVLLKNIEEASPICTVTIEGTSDHFSTSILDVQLESNQITIDKLSPPHGNQLLANNKCKLSAIHDGIHLAFPLDSIETDSSRDISFYKVAIPNRIYYPQRRSSPRIQITALHIPFSGISERTKATVGGSIFDISRTGLCLGISITNNIARLQRGDSLKNCRITFEDQTISFDLAVRFVKTANKKTGRTMIGGYFENFSSKSRQKLERFVAALEREEIRNRKE